MADGEERFTRAGANEPALVLDDEPVTFAPPSLPGHRMLRLKLRNASAVPVALHPREADLLDDAGESLRATAAFGRAHAATTGRVAVGPGETLSVDLVWRARPGAGFPTRVVLGSARVGLDDVPTSARPS